MENDVIPFEYRVKWSIKGGKDFYEQDSTWQVGDWLGITLQSPLQPVYLTFEPDVEQLKENMIRYVDLQIKYLQFGREIGKTIRIRSSFSGENIIDSFYIDKASPGYIYRLVFNHSYRGQLATEWQPNFDLEKVDGILPREIIENDEVSIKKFMEQAKKIETNIVIDTYAKMLNTAKPKR